MKKRHYYLLLAAMVGVLGTSYLGWLIYEKGAGKGTAGITVSADEDPGGTLRGKVDDVRGKITVDGLVTDVKNMPQSGTIIIAAKEYKVSDEGKFTAYAEPGVYTVVFVQNGINLEISPATVQLISSGDYSFVITKATE